MKIHELKTWPEHFDAVYTNDKRCEIRKNDRDYQVDDAVILREWRPGMPNSHDVGGEYTGRVIVSVVLHMASFEQQPGSLVLSLGNLGRVI